MENKRKVGQKSTRQAEYCYNSSDDDTDTSEELVGFDSDEDFSMKSYGKRLRTSEKKVVLQEAKEGREKITRKPTRRPDPNVFNRNALLARENRKRKKERAVQMEQENEELQTQIQKLQKVIKRQEVVVTGLRNERNYLKSVINNQSEIVGIIKKLKGRDHCAEKQMMEQNKSSPTSQYSDYSSMLGDNGHVSDEFDHGTATEDPFLLDESLLNATLFSTDLLLGSPVDQLQSFCDLDTEDLSNNNRLDWNLSDADETLKNVNFDLNEDLRREMKVGNKEQSGEVVRSEHNYFYSDSVADRPLKSFGEGDAEMKAGICLHINGGKVSLEFCSRCHRSATEEWQAKRM